MLRDRDCRQSRINRGVGRLAAETLIETLRKGEEFLARKGVPSARLEAQMIFAHILGLRRIELFTQGDRPLAAAETEALRAALLKKAGGMPTAQILGSKEFYGRTFQVSGDVLIPRPETEELVELVLKRCPRIRRVADLGAGTGCIGITLALEAQAEFLALVDISPAALGVAKTNAMALLAPSTVPYELFAADFTATNFALPVPVDVVVSNPPYVLPAEYAELDVTVRDFEPRLALVAEDFAALHRALIGAAFKLLEPGGLFALETHPQMAAEVAEWLRRQGFVAVEVCNDLAARPHFVVAHK